MSLRTIASGVDTLLTSLSDGEHLSPNKAEQRFVTFVTEAGSVHTLIVDVDHVAQDAESIVQWFEHAKTAVEHLVTPTQPGDETGRQAVEDYANDKVGGGVPSADAGHEGGVA